MLLERQTEQVLALARSVATSSAGWVASRDFNGLQEIITAQARYPELLFAMVLNKEGQVLAHSDVSRLGLYIDGVPKQLKTLVLTRDPALVDVISPVVLSGNLVGWVRIGLGQKSTAARLAIITRDGFIYGFIAILLGSILAWIMGTRLTRRLQEIERTAEAIESGSIEHRARVEGRDEISHVANAFNTMLDGMLSASKALKDANQRASLATESAKIGIWEYDHESSSMVWDDWTYRIYGVTEKSQAEPFQTWQTLVHPDDIDAARLGNQGDVGEYNAEFRIIRPDGEIRWIKSHATNTYDDQGNSLKLIGVNQDITERKQADRKLERIAHYDLLTDLPNRVLLADRLKHAMVQCQRRNQSLAVAYMDLDDFKAVYDTHGHNVGDELLVALSKRMKVALREGDTLARIGGDEFIAIMVDLEKIKDSEPVLKRLLKAAAKPATVGDTLLQVSASIGVTLYPQDGVDADQLIRHADEAMYVAKHAGKNRYHLFDTTLDREITIRRESIDDVSSALARCEFVLYYQPKVNMRTGDAIGVEALIRWQHPVRDLVPPLAFLPAIEGHTISLELGEWVIGAALSQISHWRSIGINLPISVNISAYQLQQRNFSTRLAALLAAHPEVNPHYLELEILETSELSDINQVFDTMNACHDLGVRFALDDFGTGYSSLTHLRRLPAYLIKIDQSFVRDMLEDADDLAIIEGVVGLANAFDRDVIAEGVETVAHGVALLKLGCQLAQGYGIARPMPADDIPEWVASWKADDSWQVKGPIE
jgi:diguanylate cyclase (GGDEF)-like protein/PAS domain S-box-containing protein